MNLKEGVLAAELAKPEYLGFDLAEDQDISAVVEIRNGKIHRIIKYGTHYKQLPERTVKSMNELAEA